MIKSNEILKFDTEQIEETKDIEHQRDHFNTLSEKMCQLLKVTKKGTPTYYQHYPIANNGKDANLLNKVNAVNTPKYGSAMLSYNKTVKTVK